MKQQIFQNLQPLTIIEDLHALQIMIEFCRKDFQNKLSIIRQQLQHSSSLDDSNKIVAEAENLYSQYLRSLRLIEDYLDKT